MSARESAGHACRSSSAPGSTRRSSPRVAAVPGVARRDRRHPRRRRELHGPHGVVAGPGGHEIAVHPVGDRRAHALRAARPAMRPPATPRPRRRRRPGAARRPARRRPRPAGLQRPGALDDRRRHRPHAGERRAPGRAVRAPRRCGAARRHAGPGRRDRRAPRARSRRAARCAIACRPPSAGRRAWSPAPTRGEVEHIEVIEAREAVIAIGGTFGGLALLIAMFVVSSTIGLAIAQRRARDRAAARRRGHPAAGTATGRRETLLVALAASLTSASCPAPRWRARSATPSPTTASRPRT